MLRVGYLGRFDPKKNLDLLIRALAKLPDSVFLHVAGDGPIELRRSLERLAVELGVEERVAWRGFVQADEKCTFFEGIDLLAMPSSYECFGVAAAEAIWEGLPTLVSTRTGIAEIVERNACGYVVEPNEQAIVTALRSVADHPRSLLDKAEGTIRAVQELSQAAHGSRLRYEYDCLLGASAADPERAQTAEERS